MSESSLPALRRTLRQRRRALDTRTQRRHTRALVRHLGRELRVLRAQRIALYWPSDGEPDLRPLIKSLRGRGHRFYLPVLRRPALRHGSRLWFVSHQSRRRMCRNRYRIPEPCARGRAIRPVKHLDLLLVPLVGFDADCHRIGMGGGFYDRALAYLQRRRHWYRPRLYGIAHDCQRLEHIAPRPWDVVLDAVFTERGCYRRPHR
ncbi:5-formyltetrahydrofolate cyclo-ligase [Marichromatium bheemlicum]|uniref:5-formyltetrahydrofolate cyclo-ligase n=1 Tax=Marichromatium bheemlicum TaxID=365339 RepID=A0ABX1I403_9GAMM|nr:5-formyltetrahydrofolate cyclo-ligase [Marichromatium bheemlicum]NKN32240.1 5-formyltetrahydrofolate cyclo-ligase [Marichromatium bheemlicum]